MIYICHQSVLRLTDEKDIRNTREFYLSLYISGNTDKNRFKIFIKSETNSSVDYSKIRVCGNLIQNCLLNESIVIHQEIYILLLLFCYLISYLFCNFTFANVNKHYDYNYYRSFTLADTANANMIARSKSARGRIRTSRSPSRTTRRPLPVIEPVRDPARDRLPPPWR